MHKLSHNRPNMEIGNWRSHIIQYINRIIYTLGDILKGLNYT